MITLQIPQENKGHPDSHLNTLSNNRTGVNERGEGLLGTLPGGTPSMEMAWSSGPTMGKSHNFAEFKFISSYFNYARGDPNK